MVVFVLENVAELRPVASQGLATLSIRLVPKMLRNCALSLLTREVPTPQNKTLQTKNIQLTITIRCPVAILRTETEIPILVDDLVSEFPS